MERFSSTLLRTVRLKYTLPTLSIAGTFLYETWRFGPCCFFREVALPGRWVLKMALEEVNLQPGLNDKKNNER